MNEPHGVKHDSFKPRIDLIPPEAIFAMAKVLTHGATKYGARNWERGIEQERLFSAAQRHLWAHWSGETLDAESGLPHLSHALTNLAFMIALLERGEQSDEGRTGAEDGSCPVWTHPTLPTEMPRTPSLVSS